MKRAVMVLILSALSLMTIVYAGTPVLGFEIGTSTAHQVSTTLAAQTTVIDHGVNKWSGGQMLKTNGSSYDIDGLQSVLYIFDEGNLLSGVVMTMDKSRFDSIYQFLAAKYKVQTQQRPFVGDQFARFKTTDGVVEVDAPHMSFEMDVRYLRKDLVQKFNRQSQAEASAKRQREASKF
jgi:hypothetical protein